MSAPDNPLMERAMVEALAAYSDYIRQSASIRAAYLRGEVTAADVCDFDAVHRAPNPPPRPPLPAPAWYHRPTDLAREVYDPYDLLYAPWPIVGGVRFRRGSGRRWENRSTRHGRLNWPETARRVRAWYAAIDQNDRTWRQETDRLAQEIGASALATVPHETIRTPDGRTVCAVVREPGGEFVVYVGIPERPPALLGSAGFTYTWGDGEVTRLRSMARAGATEDEARARYREERQEGVLRDLGEMLRSWGCSKAHVRALAERLRAEPR